MSASSASSSASASAASASEGEGEGEGDDVKELATIAILLGESQDKNIDELFDNIVFDDATDKNIAVTVGFFHSFYFRANAIRSLPEREYEYFISHIDVWLAKSRSISYVPLGYNSYNNRDLYHPNSRLSFFSVYQDLFKDFYEKCTNLSRLQSSSLTALEVKTKLQEVFSIENIGKKEPEMAKYLDKRQQELFAKDEPRQAAMLTRFFESSNLDNRISKLRAENLLCQLEFYPVSLREFLLMVKNKVTPPANFEFSAFCLESIINLTNPSLSINLMDLPEDLDLSDLLSFICLKAYLHPTDLTSLEYFMTDINDVIIKWNHLFSGTLLEVLFGNTARTRIILCTNLFMRLLVGMLLLFLTTIKNSGTYTKDPILTSGQKLSELHIFYLLDYFTSMRIFGLNQGCQVMATKYDIIKQEMITQILTSYSPSLASQVSRMSQEEIESQMSPASQMSQVSQMSQMSPASPASPASPMSQKDLGLLTTAVSVVSKLFNTCVDKFRCAFGANCSSSVYDIDEFKKKAEIALQFPRPYDREEFKREDYQTIKAYLVQQRQQQQQLQQQQQQQLQQQLQRQRQQQNLGKLIDEQKKERKYKQQKQIQEKRQPQTLEQLKTRRKELEDMQKNQSYRSITFEERTKIVKEITYLNQAIRKAALAALGGGRPKHKTTKKKPKKRMTYKRRKHNKRRTNKKH
jgi:hypothetical protein